MPKKLKHLFFIIVMITLPISILADESLQTEKTKLIFCDFHYTDIIPNLLMDNLKKLREKNFEILLIESSQKNIPELQTSFKTLISEANTLLNKIEEMRSNGLYRDTFLYNLQKSILSNTPINFKSFLKLIDRAEKHGFEVEGMGLEDKDTGFDSMAEWETINYKTPSTNNKIVAIIGGDHCIDIALDLPDDNKTLGSVSRTVSF